MMRECNHLEVIPVKIESAIWLTIPMNADHVIFGERIQCWFGRPGPESPLQTSGCSRDRENHPEAIS